MAHDGRTGLHQTRVQFNAFSKDYEVAWNLREALNTALVGGKWTLDGIQVEAVMPDGRYRMYHPSTQMWAMVQDLMVTWRIAE